MLISPLHLCWCKGPSNPPLPADLAAVGRESGHGSPIRLCVRFGPRALHTQIRLWRSPLHHEMCGLNQEPQAGLDVFRAGQANVHTVRVASFFITSVHKHVIRSRQAKTAPFTSKRIYFQNFGNAVVTHQYPSPGLGIHKLSQLGQRSG